jgi:putative methyltransferase (TIGR04325 family)
MADALNVPPVSRLRRLRWEYQYRRWPGAFRGVYADFEEALSTAPPGKVGYDHPELASAYRNRLEPITSEYPVMFWLQRALDSGARRVFDYGGHVGLAYHAFERRVQYPSDLAWRVCDLPSMVTQGRELARQRDARGLTFTSESTEADGFDVLFSQGALQYIDRPLSRLLEALSHPPRHLLLNQIPLADGPGFVTLQNTIVAYTPYRIFSRLEFLGSLQALGYELVDAWRTPELAVHIPFHPDHVVESYSGVYLRRALH